MDRLKDKLIHYLAYQTENAQSQNLDRIRFPNKKLSASYARQWIQTLIQYLGKRYKLLWFKRSGLEQSFLLYMEVIQRIDGLDQTYQLLADESSRDWLISLLAYRILGRDYVKLKSNTDAYWRAVQRLPQLITKTSDYQGAFLGELSEFNLESVGYPICFLSHPLYVLSSFLLEQYALPPIFQAEAGDIVIDGGGCWGDTALYFAEKVQEHGFVYCFEFSPQNLVIFEKNLALNPSLQQRIEIIPHALWSETGQTFEFSEAGPGTRLGAHEGNSTVSTTTLKIDDFVAEHNLQAVDFIKLDIEGAELDALKGAEQTLRQYRPKLAIALYHHLDDFITIPQYLNSLGLNYQFYLGHYTIHLEETILFAIAAGEA